jgi:threonyl-tRNA synthetase
MTYTDADGELKRPILVHRAIFGSLERFVGGLIEHFSGNFPVWCAPTQVALIPIREEQADYCRGLERQLQERMARVDCMTAPGHMNKKIKEAQRHKVPFQLIVGEREVEDGTVAIRRRGTQEQEVVPFAEFLELLDRLIATRSRELR